MKASKDDFVPVKVQNNMVRNLWIAGLFIVAVNVAMVCAHKKFRQDADKNEI